MKYVVLLTLAMTLLVFPAWSQTPQWQVQPTVCINQQVGDSCQLKLRINASNLGDSAYWLILANEPVRQVFQEDFPLSIELRITQNTQLSLIDADLHVILNIPLLIKSQQAGNQRRRLRNPWSLF